MAAKRIVAFLATIVLIVAAIFIRRAIDDPKDDPATPTAGTNDIPKTTQPPATGQLALICVADLRVACEAFAADHAEITLTVEPYNATKKRFESNTFNADGWITLDPLNGYAGVGAAVKPLAQTPMVAVVPVDKPLSCTTADWKCVGDDGGAGRLIGHTDPRTSAIGLAALGALSVGFAGNPDFNEFAIDDTDGFADWLRAFERRIDKTVVFSGESPFKLMAIRKTKVNIAVGTQADFLSQRLDPKLYQLVAPNPQIVARAVWVSPTNTPRLDEDLFVDLARRLVEGGWGEVPPSAPPTGLPAAATLTSIPANAGL
jgi:Bacterial extracellular solute-binding protein